MNPKVTEGSLIGHKTWLGPSLPCFQRGDKGGMSIGGGIVRGGKEVLRVFDPY